MHTSASPFQHSAAMAAPTLELFFDVVSPYSWFGFEQLLDSDYCAHYTPILRPAFLGGIMKATGNQPPATLPARGAYMIHDLQRNARYFGLKLVSMPSNFPVSTLKAQRLLALLSTERPAILVPAARALWRAYWGDDRDISTDAALLDVLVGVLSAGGSLKASDEATALLRQSGSEAVKKTLVANTDAAIAAGAFGAPWFVLRKSPGAEPQSFFGSDRFTLIFQEV
jgi:glutathione S-transferase kappa 1